jgi:hypothetical protein
MHFGLFSSTKEAPLFSSNTIQDSAAFNKMPLNLCRPHAVITALHVTYFGLVMNRLSRGNKEEDLIDTLWS